MQLENKSNVLKILSVSLFIISYLVSQSEKNVYFGTVLITDRHRDIHPNQPLKM